MHRGAKRTKAAISDLRRAMTGRLQVLAVRVAVVAVLAVLAALAVVAMCFAVAVWLHFANGSQLTQLNPNNELFITGSHQPYVLATRAFGLQERLQDLLGQTASSIQHSFPMLVREGGDPLPSFSVCSGREWHHSGFILNQEAIQEGRDWSHFSRWSWWPRRSRWPWWPRRPWHQAWRPGAGDTGPVAHLVCHGCRRRSRGPKA
mmetsp:Transcript_6291/g.14258  ORF Transcript_6291/g.14258 Transcript_6291/m.14258 type:complete len:204 (+) Transcript_6291:172-783(+)